MKAPSHAERRALDQLAPLTLDADLCRNYAALPDKFVVDLVNGLDVARDHVAVQRHKSTRLFGRLLDGVSGRSAQRQVEVNERLTQGLESSLTWLTELNQQVTLGHRAVARVSEKVASLAQAMAEVADHASATRRQLKEFAQQVARQFDHHAQELARLDLQVGAGDHLQHVLGKWEAGRYAALSPAARCYAALEELRWGDYGEFMRRHPDTSAAIRFEQTLQDSATTRLVDDLNCGPSSTLPWAHWHQAPDRNSDEHQVLDYYGEGYTEDQAPVITSIVGQRPGDQLSVWLPRMATAGRVAGMLISEVGMGEAK